MHSVLVYLINFIFFINKKDSIKTQQNVARNEDDNSQPSNTQLRKILFFSLLKSLVAV